MGVKLIKKWIKTAIGPMFWKKACSKIRYFYSSAHFLPMFQNEELLNYVKKGYHYDFIFYFVYTLIKMSMIICKIEKKNVFI